MCKAHSAMSEAEVAQHMAMVVPVTTIVITTLVNLAWPRDSLPAFWAQKPDPSGPSELSQSKQAQMLNCIFQ